MTDLRAVAEQYLGARFPGRPTRYLPVRPRLDEDFCRAVARFYDRAPHSAGAGTAALYRALQREDLRQYRAVCAAGIEIRPWRRPGQPYRDSATLIERVARTGTLWVYLSRTGHGPAGPPDDHPMRAASGVVVDGEPLCHNDILRVVHDVFGHVALGASFGPRGEFTATYGHMRLYPREVWPVLFTEQVGQICWFFFGPHAGRLPPARRPYPAQKVFLYPQRFLDRFEQCFHPPE
ncbi:crotonobetainyl-CoA--carnitine CoA-transferase [Actinocrispum wychmicini]|uniref:crotonobetainyl-CoA--carnitine CoA-transferase n=1 Tax=Actinocrispum wychmicini TaxID=1213861 RepID=UPI001A9E12B9|nr:crotonobetainyl-CoA--carnitine CoA-transferase [Actinocrispum wychmicini]